MPSLHRNRDLLVWMQKLLLFCLIEQIRRHQFYQPRGVVTRLTVLVEQHLVGVDVEEHRRLDARNLRRWHGWRRRQRRGGNDGVGATGK